jgi:hypothetical protein
MGSPLQMIIRIYFCASALGSCFWLKAERCQLLSIGQTSGNGAFPYATDVV